MTTAVIGATGRVGSEIVRGLLARGDAVVALVRDLNKARLIFGEPDGLHIRPTHVVRHLGAHAATWRRVRMAPWSASTATGAILTTAS